MKNIRKFLMSALVAVVLATMLSGTAQADNQKPFGVHKGYQHRRPNTPAHQILKNPGRKKSDDFSSLNH